MPEFLERRLRAQARKKGFSGERADRYVYGAMNDLGAMHGSKETAKGREMEHKHNEDTMKPHNIREVRIEVHRGKDNAVTGHTVHHHLVPKKASKSGAFMEETHHSFPFGPHDHARMMKHVASALGGAKQVAEKVADQEEAEGEGGDGGEMEDEGGED